MKYKTRNAITAIAVIILVAAVITGSLAIMTKGFKDWSLFGGKASEQAEQSGEEISASVTRTSARRMAVQAAETDVQTQAEEVSLGQVNMSSGSYAGYSSAEYITEITGYDGNILHLRSGGLDGAFKIYLFYLPLTSAELPSTSMSKHAMVVASQYYTTVADFSPNTVDYRLSDNITSHMKSMGDYSAICFGVVTQEVYSGPSTKMYLSDVIVLKTSELSPYSLPETPVKEGYTFVGWYLDEALTQPYNGQPITEDMTFYAKFEINTYTVTYDSRGGSEVSSEVVDWNTSASFPTPTKTGYNFLGWYSGETLIDNAYKVKEDMLLTAAWEIKTFTVTFKVDGETYHTMTVNYGTTLFSALETAKLTSYKVLSEGQPVPVAFLKEAKVTEDITVDVAEKTEDEKRAEWLAANMWLIWTLVGVTCAAVLSAVIASLVADKRK